MQPLVIECQLMRPWCPPSFAVHLDGLVAWSMVDQALRAGEIVSDYDVILSDLPFDRHASGVWKASQFFPVGWQGQERRYVTGKTPEQDMALALGHGDLEAAGGRFIDTQRGLSKNFAGYITIEHVQGLRAWCIGDEDALREYLERIQAIGTRTRMGFGTLRPYADGSYWRIAPSNEALERWTWRSSPVQLNSTSYPSVGSWKPPYWQGNDPIWRPIPVRLESIMADDMEVDDGN